MSSGNVIELPIPLGFSFIYFTSVLSIPFAYSHIIIPCFPNLFCIINLSVLANSPIVFICILFNLGTVFLPNINKSAIGNGHIFSFISLSYNVCILSGFSKSDAIFANNLLWATPIFTVKPSSFFILFPISLALFISVSLIKYCVISKKHSSILNLSILSVYSNNSWYNWFEYFL